MQPDGQVYMDFEGGDDTLEDRMRFIEAELKAKKELVEERYTRAMEEHYEAEK